MTSVPIEPRVDLRWDFEPETMAKLEAAFLASQTLENNEVRIAVEVLWSALLGVPGRLSAIEDYAEDLRISLDRKPWWKPASKWEYHCLDTIQTRSDNIRTWIDDRVARLDQTELRRIYDEYKKRAEGPQ